MTKEYLELFRTLTRGAEVLAERASSYDTEKGDKKSADMALAMRDNYRDLGDRLNNPDFDINSLTRADFAKLFICAFIVSQNLEIQLKQMETALKGYRTDLIPKLDRILNEAENTYEAVKLAEEIFS